MSYGFFQTSSGNGGVPTPPTIIWYEVTRAQALVLISNSTVVKGAGYLITDKSIVLYGDDENAFKLEGSLIVNATTQDVVHYDIVNDLIVYREDKNGNKVSCSSGIGVFPFNNSLCKGNIVNGLINIELPTFGFFFNQLCLNHTGSPAIISSNNNQIIYNTFVGQKVFISGCQSLISSNECYVFGAFTLKNLISAGGFIGNVIKTSDAFTFDNTSLINTDFAMIDCNLFCNNVTIDMTANCWAVSSSEITCQDLLIKVATVSIQGKCHYSEYNYTLEDYGALYQPSFKQESEFGFVGRNFGLGTKLCYVNSPSINVTNGRSRLELTSTNSFSDASIYAWVGTSVEYATEINPAIFSRMKNIRIWNNTGSDKYIVFQKQNGAPYYEGQFFSEIENVIVIKQNEYADFQLCSTYNGALIPEFYQLIYKNPSNIKTEQNFEGNYINSPFRQVTAGGGNSITLIPPSLLEPNTIGSVNLGAAVGTTITYCDSNTNSFPTVSTNSVTAKFIKTRARQLSVVANIDLGIGFNSGAGASTTGFRLTAGVISTFNQEIGNPSIVTNILPVVNIVPDANWHEYTTIITSTRIIHLYDNKIVQVTNQKPTTPFSFAKGVIVGRGVTADAYSFLIEKFIYSKL